MIPDISTPVTEHAAHCHHTIDQRSDVSNHKAIIARVVSAPTPTRIATSPTMIVGKLTARDHGLPDPATWKFRVVGVWRP